MSRLFVKKSLDRLLQEEDLRGQTLKRTLGPVNLVALGLAAFAGYGALILTGVLSARYSGPAILISIGLSSLAALLSSLCYAEFASMVPTAGSAYTYAYASLGELPAWMIAWELLLEYTFGAAMIGWGWSGYLGSLLRVLGITLPPSISGTPWDVFVFYGGRWEELNHILPTLKVAGVQVASLAHTHGIVNLPGILVILFLTCVLVIGVQESANVNGILVFVKFSILLFFIISGSTFLLHHPGVANQNLRPFLPRSLEFGEFGWSGVARAAAIFFATFLGIDAVATTAEEAKNPRRDLVIGIVGSVVAAALICGLFALVLVSAVNYRTLDVADPLAVGMDSIGLHWGSVLITLGALGSLCATLLVMLLGASRVLLSVSRDGLLPRYVAKIHPKYRTPWAGTLLVGIVASAVAGILPFDWLANLFSIGVLSVFLTTCVGVAIIRVRAPEKSKVFRVPYLPTVVFVNVCLLTGLMLCLPALTWIRFGIWLLLGLLVYFWYGRRGSVLQKELSGSDAEERANAIERTANPEIEFLSKLLQGALQLFVLVLAMIGILAGLSAMLPRIESIFPASVPTLAGFAVVAGIVIAIMPSLRALRVATPHSIPAAAKEVDEFITRSREVSDDD